MFSYACVECVAFIAELDMGLKRSEWVEEEIQRVLNNLRCIGWKPLRCSSLFKTFSKLLRMMSFVQDQTFFTTLYFYLLLEI